MLLGELLHGLTFLAQFVLSLLVIKLQLRVPVIQVSKLFVLKFRLFTKAEILDHDVAFDLRDVFLSLLDCVLTEVIQKLRIMSVNLLFLSLSIFLALLLNLSIKREEHLVTVFLVFDFSFPHHLLILELKKLLLRLKQSFHLSLLVVLLQVIALVHFDGLSFKPAHRDHKSSSDVNEQLDSLIP